jgi:hypothetical protein
MEVVVGTIAMVQVAAMAWATYHDHTMATMLKGDLHRSQSRLDERRVEGSGNENESRKIGVAIASWAVVPRALLHSHQLQPRDLPCRVEGSEIVVEGNATDHASVEEAVGNATDAQVGNGSAAKEEGNESAAKEEGNGNAAKEEGNGNYDAWAKVIENRVA